MRRRLIALVSVSLMLSFVAGASAWPRPHQETKRRTPYFVGNFNTCDFSQWRTQGPAASFKIVDGPKTEGACAAALTVGPWASPGLGESRADGAALYLSPAAYGTVGRTVWQHFSVRFTPGFRATVGEWNWFIEWHGFHLDYGNLCWTIRNLNGVSRIAMRIIGGSLKRPRTIWVNGPRLRTGHWYDFRVRAVWSPYPKQGLVQWWLDGSRMYSRHIPTLYTLPDGSVSRVYFVVDNYRLHAAWDSTILVDGVRLGPTRSSVHY
jgi:Polysaccharide lyase